MTKMAAMPIYGKNLLIIFSGTNGTIALEPGIERRAPKNNQEYATDELGLSLTFLWRGQIWGNANT